MTWAFRSYRAALYGNVNYQTGLERDGFAYGGELGLKVAW